MKAFILFCFFAVVSCQADLNNLELEHRRHHDHHYHHQQYQSVDFPKIGREGEADQLQVQRRFFPAYPAYGVGGGGYAGAGAAAGINAGIGINAGLSAGISAGANAGAAAGAYGYGGYGGYGYPGYPVVYG